MSNITTRSGRKVTKPTRWEPEENVTDDFDEGEYDTDDNESDVSSVISYDSEEDSDDGSDLDDFIVDDEDVEEENNE